MPVTGTGRSQPSAEVLRSIAAASRQTGVSFDYLLKQAKSESAFNPQAKAQTSSASGLYQFTQQTWLATLSAHGADHGLGWAADAIDRSPGGSFKISDPGARQAILDLRTDPEASAAMAAELASDNGTYLSQQLGRSATSTDLALAHFLGAEGAAKFLSALAASPDSSAAPLFPEAAEANHSVFFDKSGAPRTLGEVRDRFEGPAASGTALSPGASGTVRREVTSETHGSGWTAQLPDFEPMPRHLSLSFAEAAYRRLAKLGGAA